MTVQAIQAILMGLVWGILLAQSSIRDESCSRVVRNLVFVAMIITNVCVIVSINNSNPHHLLLYGASSSLSCLAVRALLNKVLPAPIKG